MNNDNDNQSDDEVLDELKSSGWRRWLAGPGVLALACAALPMFITVDLNGLHPVALACGGVGVLAALAALVMGARARDGRRAGVAGVLLLVCAGHVLTGGLFNLGFDDEAAARAVIMTQGIQIDTWTRRAATDEGPAGFGFTGTRAGDRCMGSVSVTPTSSSNEVVCGIPALDEVP